MFEHLEIAKAAPIDQLASRAGEEDVARRVGEIKAEDEAMAATIDRN